MHKITAADILNASLDLTDDEVTQTTSFSAKLPGMSVPQLMNLTARVGASRDRLVATTWCSDGDRTERARLALRLGSMWAGIEDELHRRTGEGRKG